jgi:hypothetical protein
MNTLVLYSAKNTPGKSDATGAFIPEAKAFIRTRIESGDDVTSMNMALVGLPRWRRKKLTDEAIYSFVRNRTLDCLALFGHGWPDGIQFGFRRSDIGELVARLAMNCSQDLRVVLYACLAAENDVRDRDHKNVGPGTDGGFADLLRDELVRWGVYNCVIDAHKTAGHASWNPYVVRFRGDAVEDLNKGGVGGAWLVAPGSEYWKAWVKKLRGKARKGHLRYRFPFMSELQIKAELAGLPWTGLTPLKK